jgi:hypothetical protein
MTECERLLMELEDKVAKWRSAREASQKPGASNQETSDFGTVQGEYLGLQDAFANAFLTRDRRRIGLGLPRWNIPLGYQPVIGPIQSDTPSLGADMDQVMCNPWRRAAVPGLGVRIGRAQ